MSSVATVSEVFWEVFCDPYDLDCFQCREPLSRVEMS
jgi:hypothetical protein